MSNRLTHLALLTLFCLSLFGCTTRPRVAFFADEVANYEKASVETVLLCSKLKSITTNLNDNIVISDAKVRFDSNGAGLIATSAGGETFESGFNQIKTVSSDSSGTVRFFSASGRINVDLRTITGFSSERIPVLIPLTDACYITGISEKRKLDILPTLVASGAVIGLLFAIFHDIDILGMTDEW